MTRRVRSASRTRDAASAHLRARIRATRRRACRPAWRMRPHLFPKGMRRPGASALLRLSNSTEPTGAGGVPTYAAVPPRRNGPNPGPRSQPRRMTAGHPPQRRRAGAPSALRARLARAALLLDHGVDGVPVLHVHLCRRLLREESGAIEEEPHRVERDALALAEGLHELLEGRGHLALKEDLVAVLHGHLEVDGLLLILGLLVLRHGGMRGGNAGGEGWS
mmetsp:Transcript_10755/g.36496  ORF Transcript_10755/g.36496 Transcript_10755/m.36496 type:complete len:220 (+) Transcript_10755:564-1223(+)